MERKQRQSVRLSRGEKLTLVVATRLKTKTSCTINKKFSHAVDTGLRSAGITVIRPPYRAPNANAYAERWVRTVRDECLDKVLTLNQAHLRRVMREYVAFFNTARPHQSLAQQIPIPQSRVSHRGPLRCRNVMGGVIHDYYRDAA